jgi:hypothetical protein
MLPLEDRVNYWKSLLRQKWTGNSYLDSATFGELQTALRDALWYINGHTNKNPVETVHPSLAPHHEDR